MIFANLSEHLLFARRGRGIARLINGAMEGDSTSWAVIGGIVVCIVGYIVYQIYSGDE